VRGPNFQALHVLLEGQYTEEWTALDAIAERIRALGELAPMGYGAFGNLSSIKDGDAEKEWEGMFKELLTDNETVIATLRDAFAAPTRPATRPPPTSTPSAWRPTRSTPG
jgi:starvation-inducible DNA-binding protein